MSIRSILKEWKKESGFTGIIQYKVDYIDNKIKIYMSYPGYLIGLGGCHYNKYKAIFEDYGLAIQIEETDCNYV